MHFTQRTRAGLLVLALVLVVALTSFAQEPAVEDRYDQIFDATQDPGRLTARFLKLTSHF